MITQIIGSLLVIGFFFFFYKVGQAFVPKESPLSKVFALGSIGLGTFFVGLILTA